MKRIISTGLLFITLLGVTGLSSAYALTSDEERKALEVELSKLEAQIDEHEATISDLKLQGKSLSSEVSRLNAQIGKINLQIKAVNLQISGLDTEIGEKQSEITVTEGKISSNKEALARAVQAVYENGETELIEVLLKNPRLSDFFGDAQHLLSFQTKLSSTIDTITDLKNRLVEEREVLALKRSDAEALRVYQSKQRASVETTKSEKNNLLKVTKGKESEYQKLLAETKKSAAEIRSRVFQLLGGGELSFDQAYKLAKLAEGATGVRAALILAVLDRESALGQNVGKCKYNQVNPKTGKQAMHPTRDEPAFLEITSKLNIDPNSITVSCANADGAYGGAMGPAQFIPSTWKLYEAKIASIVGVGLVNPWNNSHAIVATGLYLRDAGAVTNEKKAAAIYYCGGNWTRYVCTIYQKAVLARAERFQDDIDILNS